MIDKELLKKTGTNITMCFLEGCPKAERCIRHIAYEMLGDQKACGSTVMPSSLKDGECNMFAEAVAKSYAKGARRLFDEVKMKHYKTLKMKVTGILGGRASFYRCIRGEKLISQEQQQRIAELFESYGYKADNLYDEYEFTY